VSFCCKRREKGREGGKRKDRRPTPARKREKKEGGGGLTIGPNRGVPFRRGGKRKEDAGKISLSLKGKKKKREKSRPFLVVVDL